MKGSTHAERSPRAQIAVLADGGTDTIACCYPRCSESFIDQRLERPEVSRKGVGIEELSLVFGIWDLFRDTSKSSVVVDAARPYLMGIFISQHYEKRRTELTVPFSSSIKLNIPPAAMVSSPAPSSPKAPSWIFCSTSLLR